MAPSLRACQPRIAPPTRTHHRPSSPALARHAPRSRHRAAPPPTRRTGPRRRAAAEEVPRLDAALDDELSRRPLELDPAGYFIIYVDREWGELVAEHYTNVINKQGLACDPVTGEAIPCMPGYRRPPSATWRGRTAKALAVAILEAPRRAGAAPPVARLEHAAYLGRELQRAEAALLGGLAYVQD
eukprot:scaffold10.g2387.t1